jgi:hypothetical protein
MTDPTSGNTSGNFLTAIQSLGAFVRDRAVLRVGALAPAVPVTPRAAVPSWVVDAAAGTGAAKRLLQMPSQRDVNRAIVLLVGNARGAWEMIHAPQEIEKQRYGQESNERRRRRRRERTGMGWRRPMPSHAPMVYHFLTCALEAPPRV